MLAKAWRTRDLASYSRGNIVLSNIGNTVHSVYVFSLPADPIWLLHTFYLGTSALMLIWSVRYAARPEPGSRIIPYPRAAAHPLSPGVEGRGPQALRLVDVGGQQGDARSNRPGDIDARCRPLGDRVLG